MKYCFLTVVVALTGMASPAFASLFGDDAKDARRIAELLDQRDAKISELNTLSNETSKLRHQAEETERAEARISELEKSIKEMEASQASQTEIVKKNGELDVLKQTVTDGSSREIKARIEVIEKSKLQIQAQIGSIVGALTGELSGEQSFKQSTSGYYAVLIGLVIVGFFALAFYDDTVRRNIFSGEAGIQFVTLFSLVIAIILFGVCGILQDKELSALLGGLSGYILGRSRNSNQQPASGAVQSVDKGESGTNNKSK